MASTPSRPGTDLPPELARLPHGRHGLPREFVIHNQRERLIAGLAAAVAEHGFAATTITHITKAAAVSRRTFYEHFESKEDCFLAAYDVVLEQMRERVITAAEAADEWPDKIRDGIAAVLDFFAAEPALARLGMVESFVAGPEISKRHREAIESFIPILRLGRAGLVDDAGLERLPETTEDAIVGGMALLIARRVAVGQAEQLPELLPDLVLFALTPYLGPDEAQRVANA